MSSSSGDSCCSSSIHSINEEELYLEQLGQAVEEKVKQLGVEVHPELGSILLKYADALLVKQENSLDPLGDGQEDADEPADDTQLAWECFEQARLCFEMQVGEQTDVIKAKSELAFIHQRLGDLSGLQGAFDHAVEEYKVSLRIMEEISSSQRERAGALVPLGGALINLERWLEALDALEKAKEYLSKVDGMDEAIQDINAQIDECKTSNTASTKTASTKTAITAKENTSVFDAPAASPGTVIMNAPIRKKKLEKDIESTASPNTKKSKI